MTHPTPGEPALDTGIGGAADRAWFAEQRARIQGAPAAAPVSQGTPPQPEIADFDAALRQAGHVPDAERGTEDTDYRLALADALDEAAQNILQDPVMRQALVGNAIVTMGRVRDAEVARLRKRIHEAVDETQRRYGKFQSRCHEFDVWSAWARDQFAKANLLWGSESEAVRLVVLSYVEEAERAKEEAARLRVERDAHVHTADHILEELHAALGGLPEDASLATFPDALEQVAHLRTELAAAQTRRPEWSCGCPGDPIECGHEAARGLAEAEAAGLRDQLTKAQRELDFARGGTAEEGQRDA